MCRQLRTQLSWSVDEQHESIDEQKRTPKMKRIMFCAIAMKNSENILN